MHSPHYHLKFKINQSTEHRNQFHLMYVFWCHRSFNTNPCEKTADAREACLRWSGDKKPECFLPLNNSRECVLTSWKQIQMFFWLDGKESLKQHLCLIKKDFDQSGHVLWVSR